LGKILLSILSLIFYPTYSV